MKIKLDEITQKICEDYSIQNFDGEINFEKPFLPSEEDFSIGLIVGASGSGKSTLLKSFGEEVVYDWDNTLCVASNFNSYSEASERLMGVGLNSVPSWLKPYSILSNGEKYRANMAKTIDSNTVFDEFTSVLDRNVSKSLCHSIQKYIRKNNLNNIVFASPHKDIIEYLQPDWVYDLDDKTLTKKDLLRQRDPIVIKFKRDNKELWEIFSKHHYLDHGLNKACHFYTAWWNDILIGCSAILPLPSGYFKDAYREHRVVVLPEFQGMGFGAVISNAIAQLYKENGCLFYTKTAHPKLGEYRNKSPLWEPSSKNGIMVKEDNRGKLSSWKVITNRISYAHKYIGDIKITYLDTVEASDIDDWA